VSSHEVVDFRIFVSELFKNPRSIGAVSPSSPALARTMARHVAAVVQHLGDPSPLIIELGPGTGAITAAVLRAGIDPDRLYLIERSAELAARLHLRFPGVCTVNADAAHLKGMLAKDGLGQAGMIISSLPLTIFSARARFALLKQSFAALGPGGVFLQYTYGWSCPVSGRHLDRLGLCAQKVDHVWRNVPPAAIWQFRRSADMQLHLAALSAAA
jgi:phosphatidylethanolamine/phosphatidyl-N-methylethanolamine N-methyltransferase